MSKTDNMEQVHVTMLTRFNKCPADFMYSESKPLLKYTYKGDILNTAVLSLGKLGPWVKRYSKYITSDFKELEKLKKVILDARWYAYLKREMIKDMVESWVEDAGFRQETKMILPWSDDLAVVGSVDFLWNEWQWFVVEDFKYSTHSWYSDEELLAKDCQKVIYPLMVMNYFDVDEVLFRFKVWDKKNLKVKNCWEEMMKRKYCEEYVDDVLTRYVKAHKNDEFPACNGFKCFYCKDQRKAKQDDDDAFEF